MALFGKQKKKKTQIPTYEDSYDQQLTTQITKILDRPAFSYDPNKDPLYGVLRDQQVQGGRMAMLDTMGQAANLTGGYASSYGQQAGQQAYQGYLQELNSMLPQLQETARAAYDSQTQQLMDQYQLTADAAQWEYTRYRDALEQAWQEEENAREAQRYADSQRQQNRENLLELITQTGYMPTQEELEGAGLTQEQVAGYYAAPTAGSGSGGYKTWDHSANQKLVKMVGQYSDLAQQRRYVLQEFSGYDPKEVAMAFQQVTGHVLSPANGQTQTRQELLSGVESLAKTYGFDQALATLKGWYQAGKLSYEDYLETYAAMQRVKSKYA